MVRLFLVAVVIAVFILLTLPIQLILFIIRCFNTKLAAQLSQPLIKGLMTVLLFVSGTKKRIEGLENIPRGTPVLFAANHRGFFDIVMAYSVLPCTHLTGFISKQEVRKVPVLSWWMILLRCKFLNRTNAREGLKTIQDAVADVKNGHSMFIMPEGTRNHGHDLLPFKPGSLKIAERTNCPVIPVAIVGTDDVFENHFPRIYSVPVAIRFGEPIPVAEMSREERSTLHELVQERVQAMLDDLSE